MLFYNNLKELRPLSGQKGRDFSAVYVMNSFTISGTVKRFEGKYGWHYVEIDESLSKDFRPMIKERWPALIRASFQVNNTRWESSIMPIKNGPLFIALPLKVRKAEAIQEGNDVTIRFDLLMTPST